MNEKISEKIAVIIPAYNEGKILGELIQQVLKYFGGPIIIVNDGSTDDTIAVVSRLSKINSNIHLLNHIINLGPFVSIHTALQYGTKIGCEYFIDVDGDGQHPPEQISKVLEPVLQGKADLVIGSRYLRETDYRTSATRRYGVKGSSKIISLFGRTKITDVNSGFRAYNMKTARRMLEEYDKINNVFEFTLRFCRDSYRVKEVPVEMESRKYGKSYLSIGRMLIYPFRIAFNTLKALI